MKYRSVSFMIFALLSSASFANTQLWLSDQPPDKELLKNLQQSHGGLVKIDNELYSKQLWLRKGDGLFKSATVESASGSVHLMDTQQKVSEPVMEKITNSASLQFQMPEEGFYNAYYTERSVENNRLNVTTAKAEALKHSCRLGHNYDRKLVNPNQWADAPLEVIRLRLPEEDFHTRIHSGAVLKFKVLYKNAPVSDALVKLETQKGWVNSTTSDQEGIATFQIIQDNFAADSNEEQKKPSGKPTADTKIAEANKKPEKPAEHEKHSGKHAMPLSDNFLLSVEYVVPEKGQLDGKPYQQAAYTVTMIGSYSPNAQGSSSRAQALAYSGAGFLTLGIGATLYRRRRLKPFREVGFDEN
ncbi:MAG: hypothetical protein NTW85_17010 [Methylococcales bacterium]|nr:hypothetical protein [Methylococcales bacterium]